jgi:SMODS and SLOG-associating 2TM effector domain 3/SMODS and SLOG-associating 2TM effector domain 1
MSPDYPPVFVAADLAATRGERRAILLTRADITVVTLGAAITVAASLVSAQPYRNVLATAAAVTFLVVWAEKSFWEKLGSPRDWFQSRAVAESAKSLTWRYMMRAAPFDAEDADARFLAALHDTLATHDEPPLTHGASRLDERQITPYMQLVRSLPPIERKACYVAGRLTDQLGYYSSKAKSDGRAGKQWRIAGLAFRGLAFALAVLRFWSDSAGVLVGLFVTLTVVVASWSQLLRYEDLAKGYSQVAHALRRLLRELQHAEDGPTIEKLILEGEGVMTREQSTWEMKRL